MRSRAGPNTGLCGIPLGSSAKAVMYTSTLVLDVLSIRKLFAQVLAPIVIPGLQIYGPS